MLTDENAAKAPSIRLDQKTAGSLLSHAGKFKPRGHARAMKIDQSFDLVNDNGTGGVTGVPGDYLVLTLSGEVTVEREKFFDAHFEPVKKRTKKGERNAATTL